MHRNRDGMHRNSRERRQCAADPPECTKLYNEGYKREEDPVGETSQEEKTQSGIPAQKRARDREGESAGKGDRGSKK